jgi:RluA family pseudouridine synthase
MDILYQDEALLVINKPAGLSTLPDGYDPALPHVKSLLEQQAGRLWIVHRLDKQTSGVLLLARSAFTHRSLNTQFEQHQVRKVYHALVNGSPGWEQKTVDLPLRPNGDRRHRSVVDLNAGKPAITHFNVLQQSGDLCLLEVIPETGRTHQIRAHLSSLGLSIIGDVLYGGAGKPILSSGDMGGIQPIGMGLHAWSLEISHPVSGQRQKFKAPYPAWWAELVAVMRADRHS